MPKIIGPITVDMWEQEVRKQLLDQLPHDWIVICNVSWSVREAGGYVRDGQSDFVVLVPNHGMVVAEVKGSRGIRVDESGNWYRRKYSAQGRPLAEERLDEPHTDQATSNMHQLEGLITKALNWGVFKGGYSYVVIYPNGEITLMPTLLDSSTVIDKKHMNDLVRRLRGSLVARGSERVGSKFSSDVCQEVASILAKQNFAITAVDTELETQEDSDSIDQLTRQQFSALKGAFELSKVAILGPAGSGKTLLAIWKLKALLAEGKRVIYVCFNKALAEFLCAKHPECQQSILNVDSFFHRIASPRAIPVNQALFFSENLPYMVMDKTYLMGDDEKYEAIIVDEGQDFGENRALALLGLLRNKESSQWLFFADWNQDIYKRRSDVSFGAEVVFNLYHNCRNTEQVTNATNQYCEMNVEPMPGSPLGERPMVEYRNSPGLIATRAWEIVNELQPRGGAVFLSPFKLENSCMASFPRGHGLELTQDVSKLGLPGFVFFSTIKSFKGLEGSLVVILQAEQPDLQLSLTLEDLYVACTRPTSRLAIITNSEKSKNWFSSMLNKQI